MHTMLCLEILRLLLVVIFTAEQIVNAQLGRQISVNRGPGLTPQQITAVSMLPDF